MLIVAGGILGAVLGWRAAAKCRGDRLDKMQFAAVGAIVGALIGMIATVVLMRVL